MTRPKQGSHFIPQTLTLKKYSPSRPLSTTPEKLVLPEGEPPDFSFFVIATTLALQMDAAGV